jgi:hypothetical protein
MYVLGEFSTKKTQAFLKLIDYTYKQTHSGITQLDSVWLIVDRCGRTRELQTYKRHIHNTKEKLELDAKMRTHRRRKTLDLTSANSAVQRRPRNTQNVFQLHAHVAQHEDGNRSQNKHKCDYFQPKNTFLGKKRQTGTVRIRQIDELVIIAFYHVVNMKEKLAYECST